MTTPTSTDSSLQDRRARTANPYARGIAVAMAGALIALAVFAASFLLGRAGNAEQAQAIASESSTKAAPPTTLAPPTTTAPPAPPATVPPVVQPRINVITNEPPGQQCPDLHAKGYTYIDAVRYWEMNNWPDNMDADLDGFPCETVYSDGEVGAYWAPTDIVEPTKLC